MRAGIHSAGPGAVRQVCWAVSHLRGDCIITSFLFGGEAVVIVLPVILHVRRSICPANTQTIIKLRLRHTCNSASNRNGNIPTSSPHSFIQWVGHLSRLSVISVDLRLFRIIWHFIAVILRVFQVILQLLVEKLQLNFMYVNTGNEERMTV